MAIASSDLLKPYEFRQTFDSTELPNSIGMMIIADEGSATEQRALIPSSELIITNDSKLALTGPYQITVRINLRVSNAKAWLVDYKSEALTVIKTSKPLDLETEGGTSVPPLVETNTQSDPIEEDVPLIVRRLAVSSVSACYILDDATVKCWGINTQGQLGDGSNVTSQSPVTVSGLAGAKSISAGFRHICALLSNRTVKCWGDNTYKQLGDDSTVSKSIPTDVQSVSDAVAIASGKNHNCALLKDGTMKCWGQNDQGQIGTRSTSANTNPTTVTGIFNVASISMGSDFTCVSFESGHPKCWGSNLWGQLGIGTTDTVELVPVEVSALTGIRSMSSGGQRSCAMMNDGTHRCSGYDHLTYNPTSIATHTLVSGVSGVKTVAISPNVTCALTNDTTVWCYGKNLGGLLATAADNSLNQYFIYQLSDVVEISLQGDSSGYACVSLSNGTVKCWGTNSPLGQSVYTPSTVSGL